MLHHDTRINPNIGPLPHGVETERFSAIQLEVGRIWSAGLHPNGIVRRLFFISTFAGRKRQSTLYTDRGQSSKTANHRYSISTDGLKA